MRSGLARRALLMRGLGFAAAATTLREARAQSFATRPVTVVLPTAAGDPADLIGRILQPGMTKRLGQPWLVDARPGASGKIATQAVARAPADGETLLIALSGHTINPFASSALPYDTLRDFAGVTLLARQPLIVAVNPSVKGDDLKAFIAAARANPSRKLTYASPGLGSLSYLIGEEISRRGGIDMAHSAFRGGSPALQALITGDVQLLVLIPAILTPQIRAGAIRAIAVTSATRLPDLPDVPTFAEMGFDAEPIYNWLGLFAPAATPRAIIDELNAAIVATLKEPNAAKLMNDAGFETVGSSPDDLDRFVRAEMARWGRFTKEYDVHFD